MGFVKMLNVFNLACPVVGIIHPNTTITCRKFIGSEKNAMGVVQAQFREFKADGQVQPQTANDVKNQLNIDVSELKMNVWIRAELHTVDKQAVADQIVYGGRVWNVTTVTNWNEGNGWGNYIVSEDKYTDPETGRHSGTPTEGKDGLVW